MQQALFRTTLAEDLIWSFRMTGDGIRDLLAAPHTFIQSQFPDRYIPFSGDGKEDVPVFIVFQYGLSEPDTFLVQGVELTNMVTVRGPSLQTVVEPDHRARSADYARQTITPRTKPTELETAQGKAPSPRVAVKRLETPQLAFAHFDPSDDSGFGYDNIAAIIRNPFLLPEWLNEQTPDETPMVIRADLREEEDRDMVTRFELVEPRDQFRFLYQTQTTPTCLPPLVLRQCSKPSGFYTQDGNTLTLHIDQAQQTLWCGQPVNPGG